MIPDSIYQISEYAFATCTDLQTITLGTGVNYLDDGVFKGCPNIQTINAKAVTAPATSHNAFSNSNTTAVVNVPADSIGYDDTPWRLFTSYKSSGKEAIARIDITTVPDKVNYSLNEELDITGGVLTVTRLNGSTVTVPMTDEMVTSTFDSTVDGVQYLKVTYLGQNDILAAYVLPGRSSMSRRLMSRAPAGRLRLSSTRPSRWSPKSTRLRPRPRLSPGASPTELSAPVLKRMAF